MDPAMITSVTTFLSPFLPYLVKLSEKTAEAVEEGGKRLGAEAWETAKQLWAKLSPKLEEKEGARAAVKAVTANPEAKGAQAFLTEQLEALLKENQALAAEVEQMLKRSPAAITTTNVIASGAGSVALGGGVSGSSISTGVGLGAAWPKDGRA